VNVLGFSMGGIVARVAHLVDPSIAIRRAVFLNTPHAGSVAAYALPFAAVRQMRPSSALMVRLASVDWRIPTLVTWCPFDAIVVPGRSANWTRVTETIRCLVPIHPWPVWSKKVHASIVKFLASGERAADRCRSTTGIT
jgi:hypothetical protein